MSRQKPTSYTSVAVNPNAHEILRVEAFRTRTPMTTLVEQAILAAYGPDGPQEARAPSSEPSGAADQSESV